LSSSIDIKALKRYRLAVGKKTREIAKMLQPEELNQKVDTNRLQQVLDEGAVVESQRWLTNYWGKRNVAGLLLMPATRHNFVHLNKARQLKNKRS
ncbi:MAG: DinB family protein, partial [Candidatus Methanofastidiosia archaeon]